jgi:hypothetical protein
MNAGKGENILGTIYTVGVFGTFVYLTFFDGYVYTAWNWIIAIPVNAFVSGIFPIYWLILHWII